jgi:putative DNA primase/helicase
LAFWTGKDAERMDQLFRLSGLYRPKWDERHGARTYGEVTIANAIRTQQFTWTPPPGSEGERHE